MPARNYCRDALVKHCIEAANNDPDAAVDVLDKVVRQCSDFLVPFACVPPAHQELTMWFDKYVKSRFSARKWVYAFTRGVESYHVLLARAYLLTPGLVLPDVYWSLEDFTEAFRVETRQILNQKQPPRIHNFNVVRDHPASGPILQHFEEQYPAEYVRYSYFYNALLSTLSYGLPPVGVVSRLCDPETAMVYRAALERAHDIVEFDVDRALQFGEQRQVRSEDTWNARDSSRCVSLLRLLCDGHASGLKDVEIGENFEAFRKKETKRKNLERSNQITEAKNLGVWRVRRSQSLQWKNALAPSEWETYQQCNAAMKYSLSSGVFSQIPRRHYNDCSLEHMRTTNLPRLRARFLLSPASASPCT